MSIQVAVRVRPFNSREIELGSELCVDMEGNKTTLLCLEDPKKNRDFSFDYSFWSHSEFENDSTGLSVPKSGKYADQQTVYNLVGSQMLDNAWEGYHCCLLAYGQTGAGKSYSMVGYQPNRGIVPIACEEIFKRIGLNQVETTEYEVCFSMLEIYNEKIQDLLIPHNKRPQGGLRIRENKTIGFYVEHLLKYPVKSYEAIEQRMEEGSRNRTIASTQMNASSSRAHTIISIEFRKREIIENRKIEKFSLMNLVDLAGSEKVGKTGATGDRLKEAGQINKSLHILGLVIMTLAEQEAGKKNVKVPYRDSCLTKILCNALGGNSKTLMICAISPSNDNYQETLSTLRYADNAKKIKNKAIINESAVDKMIRELTQENQILKNTIMELRNKMVNNPNFSVKEIEALEDELQAMDDLMNDMKITHQQRVEECEKDEEEAQEEREEEAQILCEMHLTNLNEDPILNGKIKFGLEKERTLVGRKNAIPVPDIVLGSMGIRDNHAVFVKETSGEGNRLYIEPCDELCGDQIHLNGEKVTAKMELFHNDRVVFGTNSTMLVVIPNGKQREGEVLPKEIDWEFAQEEIAQKAQKDINRTDDTENQLKQESIEKLKQLELERQAEKAENDAKIKEQTDKYQANLLLLEDKFKEESQKQKLEHEKIEAQRQCNEIVSKLEAECIQKELLREKQKQQVQNEEQLRVFKIKSKLELEMKLKRVLPQIYEVGFISKELKRDITFQPKILYTYTNQSEINAAKKKQPTIYIHVKNNEEGSEYDWDLEKFQNRYFIIKGILDRYFETNRIPELQQNEDPFWDPPEPFLIGQGFLILYGLAFGMDNQTKINLVGDNGTCGSLEVGFIPCNETGDLDYDDENINEDLVIEDPNDLLHKQLNFKIVIKKAQLPENFCTDTLVEYALLQRDNHFVKFRTNKLEGKHSNPNYNYSQIHSYKDITMNIVKYLSESTLQFKVFGFDDAQVKQNKLQRQRAEENSKKANELKKQEEQKKKQQKQLVPAEEQMEKQRDIHRLNGGGGAAGGGEIEKEKDNYPHVIKIESKYRPQKVSELKLQKESSQGGDASHSNSTNSNRDSNSSRITSESNSASSAKGQDQVVQKAQENKQTQSIKGQQSPNQQDKTNTGNNQLKYKEEIAGNINNNTSNTSTNSMNDNSSSTAKKSAEDQSTNNNSRGSQKSKQKKNEEKYILMKKIIRSANRHGLDNKF